ncbi:hypothetical protein IQ238_03195 [Pleurocapsales cyanobacterium LEGE 06147]|nr:hypothetical protein [Pleurocapsales cyanobacterium LEGE 06147]
MSYAEPYGDRVVEPGVTQTVVNYHDRVRWGPIVAGIVVAIATQLVLSTLGVAIGLTTGAPVQDVGVGVGIWSIISLLIALFLGSWVTTSTCGPMNNKTALLHGLILWATTLALSAWLVATGVTGAFGIAAGNAAEILNQIQQPGAGTTPDRTLTEQEARALADIGARTAWSFLVGSLLGLAAALIGASVGARKSRAGRNVDVPPRQPDNRPEMGR